MSSQSALPVRSWRDGSRRLTFDEQVVHFAGHQLAEVLSKAFNDSKPRNADERETAHDLVGSIRQATDEMRKVSEESRKLAVALQLAQPARGDGGSKKADGFFRRLWDR